MDFKNFITDFYLQENCKDSTEDSYVLHAQFPLLLMFYIVHLLQWTYINTLTKVHNLFSFPLFFS